MNTYTQNELQETKKVLTSLHNKCEKAQKTIGAGSPQYTLLANRIKGLAIALALVEEKLK